MKTKADILNCKHEFQKLATLEDPEAKVRYVKYICSKCSYVEIKQFEMPTTYEELSEFKRYVQTKYDISLENQEIVKRAKKSLDLFVQRKEKRKRGLLFYGPRGTGKTQLAVSLLKYEKKRYRRTIAGVNFSNLVFERYTDISLSKNNGTELYSAKSFEKEHFCKEAEILLLDEVGKGRATDFVNGLLYSFVENTYSDPSKFLIITTNLNPEDLEEEFDSAIASRIVDLCTYIDFAGLPDMRVKM